MTERRVHAGSDYLLPVCEGEPEGESTSVAFHASGITCPLCLVLTQLSKQEWRKYGALQYIATGEVEHVLVVFSEDEQRYVTSRLTRESVATASVDVIELAFARLRVTLHEGRFFPADGPTGDPRPSKTLTRSVPGESRLGADAIAQLVRDEVGEVAWRHDRHEHQWVLGRPGGSAQGRVTCEVLRDGLSHVIMRLVESEFGVPLPAEARDGCPRESRPEVEFVPFSPAGLALYLDAPEVVDLVLDQLAPPAEQRHLYLRRIADVLAAGASPSAYNVGALHEGCMRVHRMNEGCPTR